MACMGPSEEGISPPASANTETRSNKPEESARMPGMEIPDQSAPGGPAAINEFDADSEHEVASQNPAGHAIELLAVKDDCSSDCSACAAGIFSNRQSKQHAIVARPVRHTWLASLVFETTNDSASYLSRLLKEKLQPRAPPVS